MAEPDEPTQRAIPRPSPPRPAIVPDAPAAPSSSAARTGDLTLDQAMMSLARLLGETKTVLTTVQASLPPPVGPTLLDAPPSAPAAPSKRPSLAARAAQHPVGNGAIWVSAIVGAFTLCGQIAVSFLARHHPELVGPLKAVAKALLIAIGGGS
jgi:hypothetical protein